MMFGPPTGLNQRTDPGASADFFNTIGANETSEFARLNAYFLPQSGLS
jgi:hypothetical protein